MMNINRFCLGTILTSTLVLAVEMVLDRQSVLSVISLLSITVCVVQLWRSTRQLERERLLKIFHRYAEQQMQSPTKADSIK
ncbi:MAG TPA: hypothetical protein VNQ76_08000 [Planctomicrobium sp.]|nr:hypothetical protein [Planctomicrobium sp.]